MNSLFFKAGSEFELDCFIWQVIHLSPTYKNLLLHHQLVMLARCVLRDMLLAGLSVFMD